MAVRGELSEVGCLLLPGVGRLELGLPGIHTSAFQAKLCLHLIIFFHMHLFHEGGTCMLQCNMCCFLLPPCGTELKSPELASIFSW